MAPVYEMLRAEDNRPAAVRLFMQSGSRPITMLLRPSEMTRDIPGDLCSIRLEVPTEDPDGGLEASFEVALAQDENECAWLNVEVEGSNPSRRHVQLEQASRVDLLDTELEVFSHDRIYEEALQMASHFIRGTERVETDGTRRLTTGEPVSAIHPRPKPETKP
jgi:hypothetical protein